METEDNYNLGEVETEESQRESEERTKKRKHLGGEAKAGKAISPRNPIKAGVMEKWRRVLD